MLDTPFELNVDSNVALSVGVNAWLVEINAGLRIELDVGSNIE
jgi:hypothetical protein